MSFQNERERALKLILEILESCGLKNNLRGSWLTKEFHLSLNGTHTYSDIDLLVTDKHKKQKYPQINSLRQRVSNIFKGEIHVSIHSVDSLNRLNLSDSNTLAIAEFISQYWKIRALNSYPIDYINAKFTLLLLRQHVQENYLAIANRIGTIEAKKAFLVKIGKKSFFSERYAKNLIMGNSDLLAIEFLNHCVLKNPTLEYTKQIIHRLIDCPSLDPWLRNYLIEKINRYLVLL